jgi:hypothetical protein
MTREEAIKQLKGDITESCATFSNQWEKDEEAISMAISALSVEPCRDADDYENEISDLHNRLDIAEYNKGYKEEITITTLEAENKGEWIPVSERLPDIHNCCMKYLVTYKHGQICTAFFTETNGRCWWSVDDIEAWQPLPEPYKKGGE